MSYIFYLISLIHLFHLHLSLLHLKLPSILILSLVTDTSCIIYLTIMSLLFSNNSSPSGHANFTRLYHHCSGWCAQLSYCEEDDRRGMRLHSGDRLLLCVNSSETLPQPQLLHHSNLRTKFPSRHYVICWIVDSSSRISCSSHGNGDSNAGPHHAANYNQYWNQCSLRCCPSHLDDAVHLLLFCSPLWVRLCHHVCPCRRWKESPVSKWSSRLCVFSKWRKDQSFDQETSHNGLWRRWLQKESPRSKQGRLLLSYLIPFLLADLDNHLHAYIFSSMGFFQILLWSVISLTASEGEREGGWNDDDHDASYWWSSSLTMMTQNTQTPK